MQKIQQIQPQIIPLWKPIVPPGPQHGTVDHKENIQNPGQKPLGQKERMVISTEIQLAARETLKTMELINQTINCLTLRVTC